MAKIFQQRPPAILLGAAVVGSIGIGSAVVAKQVWHRVTPPSTAISRAIATSSGRAEMSLAEHLSRQGVKMYGAHWCGACSHQKNLFGQQAFTKVQYIECGTNGPGLQLCRQANIRAFPTWKLPNGHTIIGSAPLTALADASGYRGPRSFRN